jgi:hypothetical protein
VPGFVIVDIHGSIPKNPNGCVSFSAATNGVSKKTLTLRFSGDAFGRATEQFRPSVIIGYRKLAQVSAYRRRGADTNHPEIDSGSISGYRLF